MKQRVLAAVFAAVVLAGFAVGFGASSASAAGERITINPWRGEQWVYRTIEGTNFPPNAPIRLFVSDPARQPFWEIDNEGLVTGPDGSIWFQILPSGFSQGDLPNGVWQLRVCAGMVCYDLNMFIGGPPPLIPAGLPAQLCTPRITPSANFPTFGPPGYFTDPRSGFTFNEIVQYCGPYATPWTSWDTFLVPANWTPGMVLPYTWPYQTVFPWPAYWWNNVLFNNYAPPAPCMYAFNC